MPNKLSNDIVDQRLISNNRTIVRIGNYINIHTSIEWQCKICNYIWSTEPNNILNDGCGCPKCSNVLKLTNEIIDTRILALNNSIVRKESYINSQTAIRWQCLICNFLWLATPNNILHGHTGCPKCANRLKLTNEIVDERLSINNRSIVRLGNIINGCIAIDWKCLKCYHIWSVRPEPVINHNTGCPKCAKTYPLNNIMIDQYLVDNYIAIQRIENYINMSSKINWKCLKCNNLWLASPSNILHNRSGCPKCSLRINEKLMHNLFDDAKFLYESQFCIKK